MKKPTRSATMRKAFVRLFGPVEANTATSYPNYQLRLFDAFAAGAAWQRRQRRSK